jgi:hypothetical protein
MRMLLLVIAGWLNELDPGVNKSVACVLDADSRAYASETSRPDTTDRLAIITA